MTEQHLVECEIEGDSVEAVAYALFLDVLQAEAAGAENWRPTKDRILQTYAECLNTVRSGDTRSRRSAGGAKRKAAPKRRTT